MPKARFYNDYSFQFSSALQLMRPISLFFAATGTLDTHDLLLEVSEMPACAYNFVAAYFFSSEFTLDSLRVIIIVVVIVIINVCCLQEGLMKEAECLSGWMLLFFELLETNISEALKIGAVLFFNGSFFFKNFSKASKLLTISSPPIGVILSFKRLFLMMDL
jgi:hypothetical protein